MLATTKAIVVTKVKYRDNDVILKCYTEDFGIVSFFLRGAYKSKRGKFKPVYFQPLTQLELDFNYKKDKGLQNLSTVKLINHYQSIYHDIIKSTIALFLSEILSIVLKEEEPNPSIYQFLSASFMWLDQEDKPYNFHVLFILNLTKYLGFYPETNNSHLNSFNLQEGKFEENATSIYSISDENLTIFKQLLGIKFDALNQVKLNAQQRQGFLSMMLLYFELHLGNFKKPKSLQILNQIFS